MSSPSTQHIIRRSRLIMPANEQRFIEKAFLRNADAIVLDLEDSVPDAEKEFTRTLIKNQIPIVSKGGSDVFVRVNHSEQHLVKDIEAAVWPGVHGIVLPKIENPDEVAFVDALITRLEEERGIPKNHIKISAIIETVKGYLTMSESLKVSSRLDSLTLGAEDFSLDSGIDISEDTYHALLIPRMSILFEAKSKNLLPLGTMGSIATFNDLEGYKENVKLSYKHGFLGASCIHPNQVEILNKYFSPSDTEVQQAKGIIQAFKDAIANGRASTTFEGNMIDYPHYIKAQQLLERNNQIEVIEKRKKQAREFALGGKIEC
jgi:citrate lyase subunit beta/citryl-CoA lyase